VSRWAALVERRAHACRLTFDRALDSLDEAEAFLHDRGLLTLMTDCSLPSLFEAWMTAATAALADPICRAELARTESTDPAAARLLEHLRVAEPSELEDVRAELGLTAKHL
jgi:hypothetical protein